MPNYNKCILVGHATKDPVLRTAGTKSVASFSIAVSNKRKGEESTMFIGVSAWERLGENCNAYVKKGMSVLVEGRLAIRKYDDKDGNKQTAVEIIASDVQFLSKPSGGSSAPRATGAGSGFFSEPARDQSPAWELPEDEIAF